MEVSTLMAFLSVWPHSNNKQTSTVIVTALRAEGEERTEDILLITLLPTGCYQITQGFACL